MQRAVIWGAGALGCVLGARLSRILPTALVCREAVAAAVVADGLRVGGKTNLTVAVGEALSVYSANRDVADLRLRQTDAVLLTVKAFDVAAAARDLAAILRRDLERPAIISLQNGTGYENVFIETLAPLAETAAVVAHLGATFRAPGIVEDWGGRLVCPQSKVGMNLAELFRRAGLEAATTAYLEVERWKKIAYNCALNPCAAILDKCNREAVPAELRALRGAVLSEASACAALSPAERAVFPSVEALLDGLDALAAASNNINSMLQDLRRRRKTERDFLNGAIVAAAARRGQAAPFNDRLDRLVARLERAGDDANEKAAVRRELFAAGKQAAEQGG
jgi:2-dehydropantoate 2-reductase